MTLRVPRFLPLALLAVVTTGCVTVRSAPPSFQGDWPPIGSGPRPSIALAISVRATDSGWPRDPGPILGPWGMATERAYRESALFANVSTQSGRADLRVEVQLRADVSRYDVFTALAWLTLFVLPTVDTTNIAAVTRVTTPNGSQSISTIEVSGRSQTWYQILLFPFSPLFPPQAVTPQIVYDLNRQTIDQLHARGVF